MGQGDADGVLSVAVVMLHERKQLAQDTRLELSVVVQRFGKASGDVFLLSPCRPESPSPQSSA